MEENRNLWELDFGKEGKAQLRTVKALKNLRSKLDIAQNAPSPGQILLTGERDTLQSAIYTRVCYSLSQM